MRMQPWKELTEIWNTPEWKEKSDRNKANINKSTGGKHTIGSQIFVTAKIEEANKLGRELDFFETWRQSHCKKGKRPLDKIQECTSTLVEAWILKRMLNKIRIWMLKRMFTNKIKTGLTKARFKKTESSLEKTYDGYLKENYGEDATKHPFDLDLWSRAGGGKNKGKLYGFNNVSDPLALITSTPSTACSSTTYVDGTQDLEIQKLNGVIEELVKEKGEDKERLNGVIDELRKEKEDKEKQNAVIEDLVKEKEAMLDRMTSFESMLQLVSRNTQPWR